MTFEEKFFDVGDLSSNHGMGMLAEYVLGPYRYKYASGAMLRPVTWGSRLLNFLSWRFCREASQFARNWILCDDSFCKRNASFKAVL